MLSYRHAFHAGNPADTLKHLILCSILEYLGEKDTPYLYLDAYAGAGSYQLDEGYSAENAEWKAGLEKLKEASRAEEVLPKAVERYLRAVADFAAVRGDAAYPGSPALASLFMREKDRGELFELHPSDEEPLRALFEGDKRFTVRLCDGLSGLDRLLPPPSRRGLTLVDPSYEMKDEYEKVLASVGGALRAFSNGVYAVWYPLLQRAEALDMGNRLLELRDRALPKPARACMAEFTLHTPSPTGFGMHGSGLVIYNPPWVLKAELEEALPVLTRLLAEDQTASWKLEWLD